MKTPKVPVKLIYLVHQRPTPGKEGLQIQKWKIRIEKVPLETYDFNKVTILGEKHRKQNSFDQDI